LGGVLIRNVKVSEPAAGAREPREQGKGRNSLRGSEKNNSLSMGQVAGELPFHIGAEKGRVMGQEKGGRPGTRRFLRTGTSL